ncbi:MAG: HAD family phosphatase [Anaerolineales bacterium]|nr:MAG: HAD family phosphatase [Anaerolineales bacterium]
MMKLVRPREMSTSTSIGAPSRPMTAKLVTLASMNVSWKVVTHYTTAELAFQYRREGVEYCDSTRRGERMYRLVFCDLDGTVMTWQQEVRPAVQHAMQAVVDSGKWITLSTSRGYQMVKPFLDSVVVNAPMICCTGALIVEASTRKVHFVKPLPLDMAHALARLSEREGMAMWFYLADMKTMLEKRVGDPGFVLRRDGATLREAPDPVAELQEPPHKVLVDAPSPEYMPAVAAQVQGCLGDRARVVLSRPYRAEVVLPGISKAWAMAWVAQYLGVKREETIGIGDGDNDLDMIKWAGLGVAMGNATPAVKAAAAWIAPSVEEDGAAEALRHFVLDK